MSRLSRPFRVISHRGGRAAKVGHRIAAAVRPIDIAARNGGDEFVVCCDELGFTDDEARQTTDVVIARLLEALHQPVRTASETVPLSASVGAVVGTGTAREPAVLIAEADAAMYEAKRQGGNRATWSNGTPYGRSRS